MHEQRLAIKTASMSSALNFEIASPMTTNVVSHWSKNKSGHILNRGGYINRGGRYANRGGRDHGSTSSRIIYC